MIDRIRKIIEYKKLTATKFASEIGVAQTTLSGHLNDQRKVSIDVVCGIINSFEDISAEWLLTGKGKMIKGYLGSSGSSGSDDTAVLIDRIKFLEKQNELLTNILSEKVGMSNPSENVEGKSA